MGEDQTQMLGPVFNTEDVKEYYLGMGSGDSSDDLFNKGNADMADDFFAPPPFKPAESLIQLKRSLRELRPLAERGEGFELQGHRVIELAIEGNTIAVKFAKTLARTPQWEGFVVKTGADVRRCMDEARKRLARWTEE